MADATHPQLMKDGFRRRGREVTRVEAFVDAAFAFSVTLLVISVGTIPDSIDALLTALKGIPAFAASFVMVALFWSAHARWSKRYGLDDVPTTLLSLLLVFLVLIYVYPLRMLFGTFFGFVSGGWIPNPGSNTIGPADIQTMFVIYGAGFVALSACLMGLYLHAWRKSVELALDFAELTSTKADTAIYAYFVVVGLLSILLALVIEPSSGWVNTASSGWRVGLPGNAYWLLALTGIVDYVVRKRQERFNVQ